ncbi:MAG: PAS domain-containing protein, partial [Congregibacter sp.]|nr:PAS domain-containing protein [Congregibacter sp.]
MLAKQSKPVLAGLIARVADLALTLDEAGIILGVEVWSSELPDDLSDLWVGLALSDTVLEGSKKRVDTALLEAAQGRGDRFDLTHQLQDSPDGLPVQYQAVAGEAGQLLLVGVDLRSDVSLRQQLVNAQQALEQDYWRLRQVETRYRRLFDMVSDAVLVLDALSFRVLEANPRATELL